MVLSTQHHPDVEHKHIEQAVIEEIIKPVLAGASGLAKNIKYLVNPTGRFVVGGPQGDCGLTGRKIIVDTYGGCGPHGGGAFSGKDPSKVDRSAAYAARYVAKNIVAAGLAEQVPGADLVRHRRGTAHERHGRRPSAPARSRDEQLEALVRQHFDLRPKGIVQMLDLLRPIYEKTAAYGHFGRNEPEFTWEKTDKAAVAGRGCRSSDAQDGMTLFQRPSRTPEERCSVMRREAPGSADRFQRRSLNGSRIDEVYMNARCVREMP